MLFQTPFLSAQDRAIIQDVDAIRAKLRYAVSTPKRWLGMLRRSTFARHIQGSNSIEGYQVSKEDAIAAIEGEEPIDTESETWAAITGYRRAMTYVLRLATDPHFEYNHGLIRSLHFMLLDYDLSKNPGAWRPGSIYVRDDRRGVTVYEGPPVDLVPKLMAEFVDTLQNESQKSPVMVKAAMAHLNLVMIHPFSDGNGRMARIVQAMLLAREGIMEPSFCSIEEYLGRNTQEYYDVLGRVGMGNWHPENDARMWVTFCLIAHYNQASTILRRTRETELVWNELETLLSSQRLPDRMIFALADAAFGFRIRNATYRTLAEINEATASRDLKALVDFGLLLPDGEKRGRIYMASPLLLEVRSRNREPRAQYKPAMPENMFLPGMEPV